MCFHIARTKWAPDDSASSGAIIRSGQTTTNRAPSSFQLSHTFYVPLRYINTKTKAQRAKTVQTMSFRFLDLPEEIQTMVIQECIKEDRCLTSKMITPSPGKNSSGHNRLIVQLPSHNLLLVSKMFSAEVKAYRAMVLAPGTILYAKIRILDTSDFPSRETPLPEHEQAYPIEIAPIQEYLDVPVDHNLFVHMAIFEYRANREAGLMYFGDVFWPANLDRSSEKEEKDKKIVLVGERWLQKWSYDKLEGYRAKQPTFSADGVAEAMGWEVTEQEEEAEEEDVEEEERDEAIARFA